MTLSDLQLAASRMRKEYITVIVCTLVNWQIGCPALWRGLGWLSSSTSMGCVFWRAPGFFGVLLSRELLPGFAGHGFDTAVRARCRRVGRNAHTPPPLLSHFLVSAKKHYVNILCVTEQTPREVFRSISYCRSGIRCPPFVVI